VNNQTNEQSSSSEYDVQRLRQALLNSPFFSDLESELINKLSQMMVISSIAGGSPVFNEGDASDSLLLVISGRLLISKKNKNGTINRLSEVGSGSSVGEVGLILQQPRAADVTAVRDTCYAQLTFEQFEQVISEYPISLNRAIARTIFEYTKQNKQKRPKRLGARTIAVVPVSADLNISMFCQHLKQALKPLGDTELISEQDKQKLTAQVNDDVSLSHLLNDLEECCDYVVYQASMMDKKWTQQVLRQADQIVLIADVRHNSVNYDDSRNLLLDSASQLTRKSLVLLHQAGDNVASIDSKWGKQLSFERVYPIKEGSLTDIQRLARLLTNNAVGVVLGGGGAKGFAHVGVLQALQEAGIPIDMIGGNSMGALIGAQYAAGKELTDIQIDTKSFIKGGERPTVPVVSLLSGKRVKRDLQNMFANVNIEALWRPFFCVSCNLNRADLQVHDSGPLWKAILASNSPAGILPPVLQNGELLVDAALLDNVPVQTMRERIGFGTIIAIDVDERDALDIDPSLEEMNVWQVIKDKFSSGQDNKMPGIVELMYRSGHIGGLAKVQHSKQLADFYLEPPLSQFAIMAYHKSDAIVEAGYRYAKTQIAQWHEEGSLKIPFLSK